MPGGISPQTGVSQTGVTAVSSVGSVGVTIVPETGYEGPLDIVPGAVAAYGQRALSAAKRGTALYTIRRDSDDTTQSFSSDATTGDAPAATISAFIGGGNGFADTWTDQSETGANLPVAIPGQQAQWVANTLNSKPAFIAGVGTQFFDGSAANPAFSTGSFTGFVVLRKFMELDVTGAATLYFYCGHAAGACALKWDDGTGFYRSTYTAPAADGGYHVFECFGEFGSQAYSYDGAALTPDLNNDDTPAVPPLSEPVYINLSSADNGIAELILFDGALSAPNRLAIRQNIAAYYGITLS